MDVSPYLSAIQSLSGESPGQKYKELHSIAAKIVADDEERHSFANKVPTNRAPPALQPALRILVGLKLRSSEAVVEALKSDDVSIIKLALGAKWFFDASNELLSVDYFGRELLPFVSLRTRLELIKALGKCLRAEQAESFHRRFVELFGSEQALPLLVGCGQDYAYDAILKNKIALSNRTLEELYRKHPRLVIRYLRLIKADAAGLGLGHYLRFLPRLVKSHAQEFVELCRSMPAHCRIGRLGSTRAQFFLANAADALVEHPRLFLDCLPLKLVRSRLSQQQYDSMLRNLFPSDPNELSARTMRDQVANYYPKDGAFQLFRDNYKRAYGKDLLERKDLLDDDCAYEVLPLDVKAECARRFASAALADKDKYWKRVYQLPPKEAIPLLKEHINKSSLLQREECLKCMLRSCYLYDSKEDLLEVLRYYDSRHKNEQAPVLQQWLQCLSGLFDNMNSLDSQHWQIVKDIVQRAYVKGDLFASTNCYFEPQHLLRASLCYFLRQSKNGRAAESDELFLDKIINIVLEYYCEHKNKWDFATNVPELQEICLEKFLSIVPQKYPETHDVWKKHNNKLSLTSYFIEKMGKLNEEKPRGPLEPKAKATKLLIQNYPWLAKFAAELLTDSERNDHSTSRFKRSLLKYCPEFYQKLIDEHPDLINDVTTNDAVMLLRRDQSKILSKIDKYVEECRRELDKVGKSTKRFVMSLKWYQHLPLMFVKKCLAEIEEGGSILILGILLEGEVLSKIIEPYLPKETKLEIDSENAKKDYEFVSSLPRALNYTNPPPPLQVLIPLCRGDYLSVAVQTLSGIAQRVSIDKVLSFANHLANNAIAVRKAGIRLVFQVAPKPQLREFLAKICKEEKNPGIREVVAKMIYQVFTQTPSQHSWQLMKLFIHDLLPDDKNIYNILNKLSSVSADYAADYILDIFKKISSFSDEELNEKERSNLIRSFLDEIKDKQVFNKLPENMITEMIVKYLLDCTLDFIFDVYLFSDEQKFDDRLKIVMGRLSDNLMQMDKPSLERPRYYPTMKKLHRRFAHSELFDHLEDNENKRMNRRLIASILENVSVRKDLDCFINFNIYQVFTETSDAKSFGEKCGKNIDNLVQIYNNEMIIEHYGKCLQRIVDRSSFKNQQFDIIDGLKSHKFQYGVLVGLKLLSTWDVSDYDERYDQFVEAAKNVDDIMTQALLCNFLREINYYDD